MPRPLVWLLVLTAAAIAYTAGAYAGKSRYREISNTAKRLWDDPALKKVRKRTRKALDKAANKAAKRLN